LIIGDLRISVRNLRRSSAAGCRFIFYRVIFPVVGKPIHIFLLLLTVLAAGANPASAQHHAQDNSDSVVKTRLSLSGGIENNHGQIRLSLTNNSSREFRGVGVIGIGGDTEQKEIGQLALTLPPQETVVLQLSGVAPSGNQFSLKVLDQNGALVYFKIAPIKSVSDPAPAMAVTLSPVSKKSPTTISPGKPAPSLPNDTLLANNPNSAMAIAEVTIKGRLLAGQSENDPFVVAFEMTAIRPVHDATLSITLGKHKDSKPVSIKRDLTVEFKLPDQLDGERISYEMTAKNGRVIVKGDLDIDQLMAEDFVTVADIRTDKSSYDLGDPVNITVQLEGKSPHGYRLEAAVKDGQGVILFQEQFQAGADNQTNSQSFTITLPREMTSPVALEFKLFDAGTGLLFDSGEREIPVNNAKRRP
jgi:hypothetical protein